jgi:hypothetical protein
MLEVGGKMKKLIYLLMLFLLVASVSAFSNDTRVISDYNSCSPNGYDCDSNSCTLTSWCNYSNDNNLLTYVLNNNEYMTSQIIKSYNVTANPNDIVNLYLNYTTLGNESGLNYCIQLQFYNISSESYENIEYVFANSEQENLLTIPNSLDYYNDNAFGFEKTITFRYWLYRDNETCDVLGTSTTEAGLVDSVLTFEIEETECLSDLSNADYCFISENDLTIDDNVSASNVNMYLQNNYGIDLGNNVNISGDIYSIDINHFNIDNVNVSVNVTLHPSSGNTFTSWVRPYFPLNSDITLNLENGTYNVLWKKNHYQPISDNNDRIWFNGNQMNGTLSTNNILFDDLWTWIKPNIITTDVGFQIGYDGLVNASDYTIVKLNEIIQEEFIGYDNYAVFGDLVRFDVYTTGNWSIEKPTNNSEPSILSYFPLTTYYNETSPINITFGITINDTDNDSTITWSNGEINVTNITIEYNETINNTIYVWLNDSEYSDFQEWNIEFILYEEEPIINNPPSILSYFPLTTYYNETSPINITFGITINDTDNDSTITWNNGEINITNITIEYNETINNTIYVWLNDSEYSDFQEWNITFILYEEEPTTETQTNITIDANTQSFFVRMIYLIFSLVLLVMIIVNSFGENKNLISTAILSIIGLTFFVASQIGLFFIIVYAIISASLNFITFLTMSQKNK